LGAISTAPERARGTNRAHEQLPIFTAPKFRASVGDEYGLTRETWMERAAKLLHCQNLEPLLKMLLADTPRHAIFDSRFREKEKNMRWNQTFLRANGTDLVRPHTTEQPIKRKPTNPA
jgi:hypothetical protein